MIEDISERLLREFAARLQSSLAGAAPAGAGAGAEAATGEGAASAESEQPMAETATPPDE